MKLSILIITYNTEYYLPRCLDSIFNQDINQDDFEVIVINDGSIDNSLKILEEYKLNHNNLKIYSQENKGEAETRNRALSLAKGVYISFVDSDDEIEPNTLGKILSEIESKSLDILYLKMKLYDENGQYIKDLDDIGDENVIVNGFEHQRRPFPATVYRKSIIKEIRYDKDIYLGTDSVFNAMVQTNALKCSYLSDSYYKYTYRLGSISDHNAVKTERNYQGFLKAIKVLVKFKVDKFPNANTIQTDYFDTVVSVFITRILEFSVLPTHNKRRFDEMKFILEKTEMDYLLKKMDSKFPFLYSNSFVFFGFQNVLKAKQSIYLFAYTIKKRFK